MSPRHRLGFEEHHDTEFAYEVAGLGRFRVTLFRDVHGVGAALRPIPSHVPTLAQLGMPPATARLLGPGGGLVLVTGPAGSGRSTTLAAMVDHVNRERAVHVVTLEDPIEFAHESRRALVHQRELGAHVHDRTSALRATLRADPDVIMLGELDDPSLTAAALDVAGSGVLVLASTCARTAATALERIATQAGPEAADALRGLLASLLRGVVAQALVPRIEGGRVGAFELLRVDEAVADLLRAGRTGRLTDAMRGRPEGDQQLLNASLAALVQMGRVTLAAAEAVSPDPTDLGRRLGTRAS